MDIAEKDILSVEESKENTVKKTTKKSGTKSTKNTPAKKKISKIDDSEVIDVKSCCVGKLIWISQKTGYNIIWDEFGTINPMTVEELRDMRNGSRGFFEKNLVVLDGERANDILEYLQLSKYYKNVKDLNDVDAIFEYDPEDIVAAVKNYSPNLKELIARRALALKLDGELDSVKTIKAVEEATGYIIEE